MDAPASTPALPSLSLPAAGAAGAPTPLAAAGGADVADAGPTPGLDGLGSGQKATPASAPAALPLGAALPAGAVPWLAPPVPLDAPVAVVDDRRVRLGSASAPEQPSLYRLCRQWVQNDADLPPMMPEPLPTSKLPPLPAMTEEAAGVLQRPAPIEAPLPAAAAGAAAAAVPAAAAGTAAEAAGLAAADAAAAPPPAIEALMQHHKQHWAAVRAHSKVRAEAAQQRHAERLQGVLAGASGSAALPMPMP